jgi:hypothetical protein
VRSSEETFAGAAAAKWFGRIRAVANHASREVRLTRLPSGRSVDQIASYSCAFVSIRGCVCGKIPGNWISHSITRLMSLFCS